VPFVRENTGFSHHSYAFTIWTNPGWTITYPPFIFLKTIFADHKTTGTAPAKCLLFLAAMTYIFTDFSFSVTSLFRLRHY